MDIIPAEEYLEVNVNIYAKTLDIYPSSTKFYG